MDKRIILLYGAVSSKKNGKQQRMIDGGCTCGYRPYGQKFGKIIYLSKQKVREDWEMSMTNPSEVVEYIKSQPDAVVWSIKHDPNKDKNILKKIKNRKLYYSCCKADMYNAYADVSLVDTPKRLRKNAKLWFKGKDPEYWKPVARKKYDYLLVGRRADKNELYFLEQLNKVKHSRKVLWIGGESHKNKIKCKHQVDCTGFIGQDEVRDLISSARVGVLFTEHPREGFPQSLLEMTMCGVPVVYSNSGPQNSWYFFPDNTAIANKKKLINSAEGLLERADPEACRKVAIENYSLQASYEHLVSL